METNEFSQQTKSSLPLDIKMKYCLYARKSTESDERVEYFNKIYNFSFNKILIKNQKTRWGSCSNKGNLNFNYKILFLPEALRDYIIVHELCHLKEFNHSKNFWKLISRAIPDYSEIKNELRKNGLSLQ